MSDGDVEPDAWQRKDDAYYTYPPTWHAAVDTDYDNISRFKPLFSAETFQEEMKEIRSELHFILAHSDLEKSLETRLETAIEKTEVFSDEV